MADIKDDNKDNKKNVLATSLHLNHGPQIQPYQPEYIFLDGAGSKQRGRFEMCFIEIGAWYTVGASIGIVRGMHYGMKIVTRDNLTRTYNRTQLINSVLKHGNDMSNKFGTILVYYSIFGTILENIRGNEEEISNNIIAGTSTGFLYKSTSGLRNCGIGGLIGFSLTMMYSLISSRVTIIENIKKFVIH
ncbi:mitochondrial import inner membrane translocase subunit Tim23-like [Melanaphis sacchari]|uniref:mitochondrial import inner membrane translocase subunit Tim23-like n=1 Tax=Melanaphis sacchari TaxID=742174 RepID=UPI000DC1475C|nr:mitochondrial import inner membrane translocase subunit Tim23-like [Melanaphis sacchari]